MADSSRCDSHDRDSERVQRACAYLVEERLAHDLAETFKALADPTRVKLISALAEMERWVGELAALLGMSISSVSHQLSLLRRLRLVRRRREGRHVYYTLDDEHIETMYHCGLSHIRHSSGL